MIIEQIYQEKYNNRSIGKYHMENIFWKLKEYCEKDYIPLHMPGHKRNIEEFVMDNPYKLDITEIDGFDNLHNPTGIIKHSMDAASKLYGSKNTFYLVNGSSIGILAAISATVGKGNKVLIARNSHKSVFNAIYINELIPIYVYPENINDLGINTKITPDDVDKLLKEHKDIAAVIITSPTYEGMISDIQGIADKAHSFNIPLIVDEAHGAHFGFHNAFPDSALICGADIVIQSIHKTLPAFTQTALLHVNGNRIEIDKVKLYLDIYQSTSPSYILMAGIDNCMEFLRTKGPGMFDNYVNNLKYLINEIKKLNYIKLAKNDDISKIVLYVTNGSLNGKQFYDILLEKYHIQLEMASLDYVIAMTSVGDKLEYYHKFLQALTEIDNELAQKQDSKYSEDIDDCICKSKYNIIPAIIKEIPYKALNAKFELRCLSSSIGRISSSSICIYPPGTPVVYPGEEITLEIVEYIKTAYNAGLEVIGLENSGEEKSIDYLNIKVIKN